MKFLRIKFHVPSFSGSLDTATKPKIMNTDLIQPPCCTWKVTSCPGLTKYHTMKMYGGMEVQLYVLTSALDGGDCLASRPDRFTAGE